MDQDKMGQKCSCMHHTMMPIFLILLGLIFLLGNLGVISDATVGIIWPILLILFGLGKIMGMKCKCCHHGEKSDTAPKN